LQDGNQSGLEDYGVGRQTKDQLCGSFHQSQGIGDQRSDRQLFQARAFDTEGFESVDSDEACKLTAIKSYQPPTANAGEDQAVDEGSLVVLDGSTCFIFTAF